MVKATIHLTGHWSFLPALLVAVMFLTDQDEIRGSDEPRKPDFSSGRRKLSHEETLVWIAENKAWKPARKVKPIWAREILPVEVGTEFKTVDHVKEVARKGSWLCVGIAGEPWLQTLETIMKKYDAADDKPKKFRFDTEPRQYRLFHPKPAARNLVAQVKGPDIEGFSIRPGYDPQRPLYSPAGGYVVRDYTTKPYQGQPKDVWLVQQALFESTYEFDDSDVGGKP